MAWQAAYPQLEILAGGGLRAAHVVELQSIYPNLALWPRGGVHTSCLSQGLIDSTVLEAELEAILLLLDSKRRL